MLEMTLRRAPPLKYGSWSVVGPHQTIVWAQGNVLRASIRSDWSFADVLTLPGVIAGLADPWAMKTANS
jgi:hypothetical protein